MTDSDMVRQRRLRYRAWHRGTKEMDLLLGTFADRNLAAMTGAELDTFERLLDVPDSELFDQVAGKRAPTAEFERIVGTLRTLTFAPADYSRT